MREVEPVGAHEGIGERERPVAREGAVLNEQRRQRARIREHAVERDCRRGR